VKDQFFTTVVVPPFFFCCPGANSLADCCPYTFLACPGGRPDVPFEMITEVLECARLLQDVEVKRVAVSKNIPKAWIVVFMDLVSFLSPNSLPNSKLSIHEIDIIARLFNGRLPWICPDQ
jgi:hypothetical protein